MIRRKDTEDTVFASVVEAHGSYSPVSELALNTNSNISALQVVHDDDRYTAVLITEVNDEASLFIVSNKDASTSAKHRLKIGHKTYRWRGPYLSTGD